MFGMYRKKMRGGDKIGDIQSQLDEIQQQVNELKRSSSSSSTMDEEQPVMEEEQSVMEEGPTMEEEQPVTKTWVDDKNIKFKGVNSGNVTLSFSRIIDLLNNNIKKNDNKKDWSTIITELKNAKSIGEVQDVINTYKIYFKSNLVAGTRRRKRHGKKRTHRRR